MEKALILLFFCCITISSFCQYSFYKEVVIIKKDSTKFSGYVEKESESSLNPVLNFKKNIEDKEPFVLPVTDVKLVVFLSDSSTFENVNYSWRKDSVKITEERLARKMIEGYASLYKLQLHPEEISIILEKNNTFVYVVKIDTNYYTLYQKERIEESGKEHLTFFPLRSSDNGGILYYQERSYYKLIKAYQGVLYYILRDYKDLREQVENLEFSDNQIIPLITKLNDYHSEVKSFTLQSKEEKPLILHGPVVSALLISKVDGKYIGTNLGYQIKITYPYLSEKISSDFGVFFDRCYKSDFLGEPSYDFVRFNIGVTYRFNNSVISPFISGGVSYYAYFKDWHEFSGSGAVGVTLYRKIMVSATIERMVGSSFSQLAPPTHFLFNLGYLFGQK